jgi:hypothetical protein
MNTCGLSSLQVSFLSKLTRLIEKDKSLKRSIFYDSIPPPFYLDIYFICTCFVITIYQVLILHLL